MNNLYIVLGILGIGIFLFLFLSLPSLLKRKSKAIIHYEEVRDKLTVREEEKVEKETETFSYTPLFDILFGIVTLAIVICVGAIIITGIGNVVTEQNMTNVTTGVIPTEFVNIVPTLVGIMVTGVILSLILRLMF